MMFRVSRILWVVAPELHFVQFPWRYAVPLGVAFGFFVGMVAGKFRKLAILAVSVLVFAGPVAKIFLAIKKPTSWNKAEISQFQRNFDTGIGYRGTPEYLPNGADTRVSSERAGTRAVLADEGSEPALANVGGDRNTFRVESPVPRNIVLNLFDYPAWQMDIDGSLVSSKTAEKEGRIAVAVPAGDHVVHVFLRRKWDAKLGIAISLATAMLLLGVKFVPLRHNQLSEAGPRGFDSGFSNSTIHAPAAVMNSDERI
jgi:hypothetical protein